MTDFARARETMVDTQLRTSSVTDRRILSAMGRVPREAFVPEVWRDLAYLDDGVPLGAGEPQRYLSAPAPFARLVQLADIAETDRVLILGTATGYSAAIVATLAKSVVAIDPEPALAGMARRTLDALGHHDVQINEGPIDSGAPHDGPFDVILVETVMTEIPKPLLTQLKDHGRLVALIGSGMTAVANVLVRSGKDIAGRAEFNARLPVVEPARERDTFVF